MPLKRGEMSNSGPKSYAEATKDVVRIVMVIAVVVVAVSSFDSLDHSGWIPHSGKTDVKFPAKGWEIGEYVMCIAIKSPKTETDLDCYGDLRDTENVREMDVTLWGQIEKGGTIFNCQRSADSITCHLRKGR
jgi:hypothetical protein